MRWVSRLTTFVLVVALLGGMVLFVRSKLPNAEIGGGFKTYTMFRDGSRLAVGSPVVFAGVRVGDITGLSIVGRFARVDMMLQNAFVLHQGSFATRRSDSLFGDSYVEIIPNPDETAPYLEPGQPIDHVQEGASTDALLRGMNTALPRIDNAMETMSGGLVAARQMVNGPFVERLAAADHWLAAGHIEGPLEAAGGALERIDTATAAANASIGANGSGVIAKLDSFQKAITGARGNMADVKSGMTSGLATMRARLDDVDPTVDNITELMGAIDQGRGDDWKGTLGRLVNDKQLADTLEDAAAAGAEGAHGFNRFTAYLGGRLELGLYSKQFRFYATAEIRARSDKFYLVEFEKSNLGQVPKDSLSDVAGTSDYVHRSVIKEGPRFTFQFGKQFGRVQFRGGLKDSTFGIGGDLLLGDGRLQLSTDLFGSFTRSPRVKVTAALAVFRSVYIMAGVDDALNSPGDLSIRTGNTDVPGELAKLHYGRDYFLGASIHFDDADLATLLRVYGALLVGLL